jgi:UDPglucose 6-dehydrogenase
MAKKIGIIGVGVVGGAVANVIPSALEYDKYKKIGSIEEINQADIIFICVNTPYIPGKGCDVSAVDDAISSVAGSKILVIKSTVIPGTTDKMQEKYPQHSIMFNPEFLRQAYAHDDMKNPGEQIIGYTEKSKQYAREVLNVLPKAPNSFVVPAKDAEMAKYFSNTFLALKVIFANQIYDLCQKTGTDYESIKNMASVNPRFAFSHFDVTADGYRGYSGACLPKDTKALIYFGDMLGVDLEILKKADEINKKLLLGNKNITPDLLKLYE